jgi:hypothetical protein
MTISSPEREAKVKLRLIAIQLKQVSKMGVRPEIRIRQKKIKLKGLESNSRPLLEIRTDWPS